VLTLVLALICGVVGALLGVFLLSTGWAIFLGIVCFLVPAILSNLWLKKRLEAVFLRVQDMIAKDQDALRRKINQMQNRMAGGGKGLQRQLEKQQVDSIQRAIDELEVLKPLYKWNLLAERQANTLRAQLCFQIKDFEKADLYLEKCLFLDPLTLAMKITRLYKKQDLEAVEKTFKKGVRRFKYDKGLLLYALYSWILVKEKRIDEAVVLLAEAKDKAESELLKSNWEHLANGRIRRFSNAALGDQWYALHLETPKPVKVRQHVGKHMR
jgi:tetratricopeptide (TPR) repeat protein